MKTTRKSKIKKTLDDRLILTRKELPPNFFPPFERLTTDFKKCDEQLHILLKVVEVSKDHWCFELLTEPTCLPNYHRVPFDKDGYKLIQKFYLNEVDNAVKRLLGKYYNHFTIYAEMTRVYEFFEKFLTS